MRYALVTSQYDFPPDIHFHDNIDSLLNDLANISEMSTVQVLAVLFYPFLFHPGNYPV